MLEPTLSEPKRSTWLTVTIVVLLLGVAVIVGVLVLTLGRTNSTTGSEDIDLTAILPPIDPATLPQITIDHDVWLFDRSLVGTGARDFVADFVWILSIEAEAVRTYDVELARAVTQGRRATEVAELIERNTELGITTTATYEFDEFRVVLVPTDQVRPQLAVVAYGIGKFTDTSATGDVTARTVDIAETYLLARARGGKVFIVDVIPPPPGLES